MEFTFHREKALLAKMDLQVVPRVLKHLWTPVSEHGRSHPGTVCGLWFPFSVCCSLMETLSPVGS